MEELKITQSFLFGGDDNEWWDKYYEVAVQLHPEKTVRVEDCYNLEMLFYRAIYSDKEENKK